jgi:hypothetical protein
MKQPVKRLCFEFRALNFEFVSYFEFWISKFRRDQPPTIDDAPVSSRLISRRIKLSRLD